MWQVTGGGGPSLMAGTTVLPCQDGEMSTTTKGQRRRVTTTTGIDEEKGSNSKRKRRKLKEGVVAIVLARRGTSRLAQGLLLGRLEEAMELRRSRIRTQDSDHESPKEDTRSNDGGKRWSEA